MSVMLVNWSDLNRPALFTDDGTIVTYGQLKSEVISVSKKLVDRSLIFLLVRNDLSSVVFYLACFESGAIPLLLDSEISPESLNRLIYIYKPNYIFSPKHNSFSLFDFKIIETIGDYTLFRNGFAQSLPVHSDLSLLLATSGSTGSPKLVRFSLQNIISNAKSIVEYLEIDTDERAITSLPFNYSYGMSVINSHLHAGASVVLTNRSFFDPIFWQLMKTHAVTSLSGVPYSYEILMKLRFERMNLISLRTLTQAGGKMSEDLTKKVFEICQSKNIRFYSMYGQTEASPRMAYLPSEHMKLKAASIGKAIPGGRLWIEDEQGNLVLDSKQVGELIYSGPNVALGYAETLEDLQCSDEWCGVLRTGDLARQDEHGFFYIEGRKSRFIKIFGVRLSLDAIELWFAERGYKSAAFGQDDRLRVIIEGEANLPLVTFATSLSAEMKIHASALSLSNISEFPRLSSGKVDYRSLNELC